LSAYSDWAEKTLVEEEGVGPTGFYGIYRDSVRDPEKAPIGYPTTGNGVRLTEVETERFGGVGAQVPKEWLDRESKKRSLAAWNSASEYMKNSGIPDHPGAKEALASMAYQLGTKWHEDHKLTDKALKEGRYGDAAREVWRSKWAGQTPSRVRTASDAFARLGGSDPLPPQKLRTGKHRGKYASTGAGDIYSAAMSGDVVAREMMGELLDPQEDEGGGVPGAVTRGDDPAPGVLDYSSISSSVSEILNRKDPQSEAVYRDLLLPSGVVAEVHSGVTDEEATRRLRKSNPEYFVAPEPRAPSDGDSNVFEAFGAGAVRSSMGLWPGARAFFASLTGDEEALSLIHI
jgi:GH24 family phage-related lysozyme (muramidase)